MPYVPKSDRCGLVLMNTGCRFLLRSGRALAGQAMAGGLILEYQKSAPGHCLPSLEPWLVRKKTAKLPKLIRRDLHFFVKLRYRPCRGGECRGADFWYSSMRPPGIRHFGC